MKKVLIKEARRFETPKHFDMAALRLHGKDETGCQKFWVGLSQFLPGGGAGYDASPAEKVYFVLDGEITVKSKDETVVLKPWESIYIGPNEGREIVNETNLTASMLLVITYPE